MEKSKKFLKISGNILAQQKAEKKINEYKLFFKTHLKNVKDRQVVLSQLYDLCLRFQNFSPKAAFITDTERYKLEVDTENLLKKYFSPEILLLYKKNIPLPKVKEKIPNPEEKIWIALIDGLSQSYGVISEQIKNEHSYRTNFLIFLNSCLLNWGLHQNISERDSDIYKRYNFIIEHYYKSPKVKQVEYKTLLKIDQLQADLLIPYEQKLPIKLNGKLIPFKSIYKIQITSSLLLDDELELFALKNSFTWNNQTKDLYSFINYCHDETDEFHRNPYLINAEREKFKNQNIYFVDPSRIIELKKIKNKDFDLVKLIQLCEELNNASATNNPISSSLLTRSIIDHIPPIFGFNNFSEVANNYSGGTKSFKKAMQNLNNSLRNIADNNTHSQARQKEVIPTRIQTDFTPELDLLLSEVARILK